MKLNLKLQTNWWEKPKQNNKKNCKMGKQTKNMTNTFIFDLARNSIVLLNQTEDICISD